MIKKFYKKLSDFTYVDILLWNISGAIVFFMLWLIYLMYSDLALHNDAAIIVSDIEWDFLITFVGFGLSAAIDSVILYVIKRPKNKK